MTPRPVHVAGLAAGVRAGNRSVLARAITLVESSRADHRLAAQELLVEVFPDTGRAVRVGVTGVPGVGKSTFIETLGRQLTSRDHRVAVLAVDPSSSRTGGSILGDKTRMARLANDPAAFVRPSPTSGTLGGVARATRESMLLVEAAGYDVVLVETVGVGQSEVVVAQMVDTFVLLSLARTGDQLQGIKKGVLELAEVVVVNKADGPHVHEAERAARELAGALRLVTPAGSAWTPPVLTCSALDGTGTPQVWDAVLAHRAELGPGGLQRRRAAQQVDWMWALVRDELLERLRSDPLVREAGRVAADDVGAGRLTPVLGAQRVMDALHDAR